jgi:transposase
MRKKHIITSTDATKARKYMSEITDKKIYRRLEVIALKGEGKKNIEIEDITKFSRQHITKLIRDFSTEGFTPLLSDGRRGNRRSVTVEDEKAFLNKYKTRAESGQVITVKEMWLVQKNLIAQSIEKKEV